jgi:hypothetical protein
MKEVLANCNKIRINIGHQHDSWIELKEALRAVKNLVRLRAGFPPAEISVAQTGIYVRDVFLRK